MTEQLTLGCNGRVSSSGHEGSIVHMGQYCSLASSGHKDRAGTLTQGKGSVLLIFFLDSLFCKTEKYFLALKAADLN
jgi:hypothetical protein